MRTDVLLAVLALVATACLWGSNHVLARAANGTVPFLAFVFWRWTLALVPMLALAWPSLCRNRSFIKENWRDLCLIGTIGVGLFSMLLVAGAYYGLAIEASMINTTTPAWAAVFGIVYGDRGLRPRQWIGLGLAFLGTLAILGQGNLLALIDIEPNAGNIYALAGAIIFAWFSTRLKRYSGKLNAFTLTTVTAAFGTVIVAVPVYLASVLIFGGGALTISPDRLGLAAIIILYAAIGPTMLGNACYVFGLSVIGPQRAVAFLYLAPVASSILAMLLLGETLHLYHFAGYGLILTGLVLVSRA